jgi:hypothetical protein
MTRAATLLRTVAAQFPTVTGLLDVSRWRREPPAASRARLAARHALAGGRAPYPTASCYCGEGIEGLFSWLGATRCDILGVGRE